MAKKRKVKSETRKKRDRADKLWKEQVRAVGACAVCGAPNVQAHHLIGCNRSRFRWDLDNGMALCPRHHMFGKDTLKYGAIAAHGSMDVTKRFMEWFQDEMPNTHAWFIENLDNHQTYVIDYDAIIEGLLATDNPFAERM